MTDGTLYSQRFHPFPWRQCPRCGYRAPQCEMVARYCRDCAAIIIENLDATTLTNIWKTVDAKETYGNRST